MQYVGVQSALKDVGALENLFCSVLQFKMCYTLSTGEAEDFLQQIEEGESKEVWSKITAV